MSNTKPEKTDARIDPSRITSHDDGRFIRTAIKLDGKIESIDVLRPDGTLFARLNILIYESGKGGSVDVNLNPETQRGRFKAWNKGVPQVDAETVKGTTTHTVVVSE